ncbi:hypothetical protein LOTGIDRAFT_228911, partial [Lottia gigantea]
MAVTAIAFCLLFLVNSSLQDFPFRNTSLSWDERVDDLVGRLTLDEIQLQMAKGGVGINGPTPAIDRLGIKPYEWDTECLHGAVGHNATAYPQSIGLAASFSTDLIFRMAEATAVEVRANNHANDAVSQGKLTEDLVRERVKPLFYTRMRLGEFDPPEMNPYASITTDVIEEKSHRDLAVEASMKSMVLLKNDGFLPLQKSSYNKIAVVGPFGDSAYIMNGDYQASPDRQFITTPRQGLSSLASSTNFAQGCDDAKCKSYDSNSVKSAVDGVDVVFICLGLGTILEAEGNDRHDMELPSGQVQLMADAVANSGSAKIVLISFNAGPVNITWADMNPRVSAIIAAFYPGQATGVALKNVMVGDSYSQFGRLPYTWYYTADQVPPITNYTMVDRTYRYMSSQPLYPFGYGLTYSTFNYDELITVTNVNAGDDNNISVHFNNVGSRTADEVVQVYIGWKSPSVPTPKIQLVNFTRVTVPQGSGLNLNFTITPQNMAVYTDDKVNSSLQDFPFRNTSLLWDERVDDLVGRLTLDEIQLQMAKGGAGINGPAPAIDRLGIKPYQWNTECLHGDVGHNATAYPQSIGLAATFSTDLIFRMAEATAVEVRATNHANVQKGSYADHTGLSCFAPVINIMRDPRWGRNQETYGEDPVLNGMLSQAYIKGLQGDHPRYVRASGGCKHFNVHGGPDDVPVSRFSFDSQVSIRDWRTTFLPAFRYCVEAGTYSLMCSYNRINGVPACAN